MLSFKGFKVKVLLIFFILVFIFSGFVYAADVNNNTVANNVFTTGNYTADNSIATDDDADNNPNVKASDLYMTQDNININDPVDGNAFLCGKDVTINNTINGNAFICADTVTLTKESYIYSSAFIFAKNVVIDGCVYDVYDASESLKVSDSGYIVRDLNAGCQDFSLTGFVRRNANISAKSVNIDTTSQKIGGNLNYYSQNKLDLNSSVVAGSIKYNQAPSYQSKQMSPAAKYVMQLLGTIIYSLIIILIIVLAIKKFADKSEELLTTKFWPVMGYGLLGLICIPIISIILCFTIIGIWFAISLIFCYIFILSIASAIFAVALGKIICNKINRNTKPMLILISILIIIALWILDHIAIVNVLVSLIVACFGLGTILYCLFHIKGKKDKSEVAVVKVDTKTTDNTNTDNSDNNSNTDLKN